MKRVCKILSLICILGIMFSISMPVNAVIGSGVLDITYDTASPRHQALTMQVDSVASTSSLQAFCVGWNFTFSNAKGSVKVYIPLSQIDTDGGSRTYVFPMSEGWNIASTGIAGAKSISNKVSNITLYENIIKAGCTVHADACIRKYSYSNGKFTALNTYANSKAEIDSNFAEFTNNFKSNTKSDYFDLTYTLDPEPIPPPIPTVTLTEPKDGATYYVGATIPFTGTGRNCDHIAGLIDGKTVSVQQGNTFKSSYKATKVGKVKFQLTGRNTPNADDAGSQTANSEVATVNIIEKPAGVYTILVHHVTRLSDGTVKRVLPDVTFYIKHEDGQNVIVGVDGKILTVDDNVIYTCPEIEGYEFEYSEIRENDDIPIVD